MLIEVIITLVIVAVLAAIIVSAVRSSGVAARRSAMQTAASELDTAISAFNRIYPPVNGNDPLMSRLPAGPWTAVSTTSGQGLSDEAGGQLLNSWPDSPYEGTGVRLERFASPAPCAVPNGPVGTIRVCRTSRVPPRPASYRIVAWGRTGSGTSVVVYDVERG